MALHRIVTDRYVVSTPLIVETAMLLGKQIPTVWVTDGGIACTVFANAVE